MLSFFRSLRYLPQYRHLVAVLTRHGLGWLADQLGLSRILRWPRRLLHPASPPPPLATLAQRLCRALEELGPSFILLGRYLGTRLDLLPPSLCEELSRLSDEGPARPAAEVAAFLERALGQPLDRLFLELSAEPWRCTWLEQVHDARTTDGQNVWVFVPSSAIQSQLEQDRPLLQDIARQVDEHRPLGWRGSATLLWQDWCEAIRQRTAGNERGDNVERWQRNFAGRTGVVFPKVDRARTAANVLTCQVWPGRPLMEFAADGTGAHEDLARSLYGFFGRAIFSDGFYPDPETLSGLVVLADGHLALTTLAPVGYLDGNIRQACWDLLTHFQNQDLSRILDGGIALGLFERCEVSPAACQAVRHLVERYQGLPLPDLRLSELAGDIFALANRGVLTLPREIRLFLRTLMAVEHLGRQLAPQVAAAVEMAPVVQQAMAVPHTWQVRGERLVRAGHSWLEALRFFPVEAMRLLSQAARGDLVMGIEPRNWQRPMHQLGRMITRLVLSMVTAGLLMSLALLVTALLPVPWGPWGWVLAGWALLTLVVLGFLLLASFLRREG